MSDALVTIRSFSDEPSARIARDILGANGIGASIRSDGASGLEPQLAYVGGVRLLVRSEDAEAALELLGDE
jgi:hypothetical protein